MEPQTNNLFKRTAGSDSIVICIFQVQKKLKKIRYKASKYYALVQEKKNTVPI